MPFMPSKGDPSLATRMHNETSLGDVGGTRAHTRTHTHTHLHKHTHNGVVLATYPPSIYTHTRDVYANIHRCKHTNRHTHTHTQTLTHTHTHTVIRGSLAMHPPLPYTHTHVYTNIHTHTRFIADLEEPVETED